LITLIGGFYSDDVAYVGTSCKKCPNGSFVSYDKAPGTDTQDCKTCPQGKDKQSIKITFQLADQGGDLLPKI